MIHVLERTLWTEADFEVMDWNDAAFHALAIRAEEFRVLFDLDYIFQRFESPSPEPPDGWDASCWIAPVTLVFEGVQDPMFNFGCDMIGTFQLIGIHRSDPRPTLGPSGIDWAWQLELNEGDITLRAYGFRQFVRRAPVFSDLPVLSFEQRGGFGFAFPETEVP